MPKRVIILRAGVKKSVYFSVLMRTVFFVILIFLAHAAAEPSQEFVFDNPPFASCHASTITETASHKLLCAYFAGSEEGAKDVGIWLSIRTAEKWGKPRLVAKDDEAPCWNPVLFTAPSGEILLFYKVGPHPSCWSGVIKRSYDDGNHWTSEELLPAGILGPVKNKPLLLKEGTLLCGSSVETWHRWGCWIDITKDFGTTWEKSAPINLSQNVFGIIQPVLFFGHEEEICLLARSRCSGTICSSSSSDGGKAWTEARPTRLPNPNAAIDAVRLHSGQIVLVFNNSSKERTPLNLAISKDDGAHWDDALVLENAPGEYSYPSIIQTQDHRIHITYTYNRTRIKHVSFDPEDLFSSCKE